MPIEKKKSSSPRGEQGSKRRKWHLSLQNQRSRNQARQDDSTTDGLGSGPGTCSRQLVIGQGWHIVSRSGRRSNSNARADSESPRHISKGGGGADGRFAVAPPLVV
jgi:hypothetical protein